MPPRSPAGGTRRLPDPAYAFFERLGNILIVSIALRGAKRSKWPRRPWGLYYGAKMLSKNRTSQVILESLGRATVGTSWLFTCTVTNSSRPRRRVLNASHVQEYVLRTQGESQRVRAHAKMRKKGANPRTRRGTASRVDADALALGGQQCVWLPLVDALEATEKVLQKGNPRLREGAQSHSRYRRGGGRAWKGRQAVRMRGHGALAQSAYALYRRSRPTEGRGEVMFETALAGTIAVHAPDYGTGRLQKHRSATTTRTRRRPASIYPVRGDRPYVTSRRVDDLRCCLVQRGPRGLQGQRGL